MTRDWLAKGRVGFVVFQVECAWSCRRKCLSDRVLHRKIGAELAGGKEECVTQGSLS
jgi:hypothetical protein